MTTVSRQRSLEQQRAARAWECVRSVTEKKKEYVSLARGAPADIQANGLGQTLAFWKAKKEPEHRQLYKGVSQWICEQLKLGTKDLLEWVISDATTNDYRRATAEAIAFLTWLKRFAEAELEHEQAATNRDRRGPAEYGRRRSTELAYPLPRKATAAWQAYKDRGPQNPGLIFDRFAPDWGKQERVTWDGRQITAKEAGLRQVSDAAAKADRDLLNAWNKRWQQLVAAAGAQPFPLWTDWRLVAGLGRDSAYEVGFTFHRYGFPILPGSSLKGLARAVGLFEIADALGEKAVSALVEEKKDSGPLAALDRRILAVEKEKDHTSALQRLLPGATEEAKGLIAAFRAIFGTTGAAGKAVFFDAIPARPPALELDVMNPHYPQYYQGSEPPADWQSPIPVYFLTVASGTEFCFAVGWRGQREGEWERLQGQAKDWLISGLTELGAGGKTSAGYGYFTDRRPTQAPAVAQAVSQQPTQPTPTRPTRPQARTSAPAVPPRPAPPATTPRQQQAVPPAPSPEPEEAGTWRTGTVIEFVSQLGRGRLRDDESGEELRFTRQEIQEKGWTPGRDAKVEYTVAERYGRPTVVRVRRLGQQS